MLQRKIEIDRKLLKNKKGISDKLWGLVYIILLAFIGVGIVSMVFIVIENGFDSRKSDSVSLGHHIQRCIDKTGFLEDNFFEKCKLNEKVVRDYFQVRVCENGSVEECLGDENAGINLGSGFQFCGLVAARESGFYCDIREIRAKDKIFILIVSSNQDSRRVTG